MSRVIVVHPEWGVCLGCALGLVYWSNIDPVGQPCAVTFADEQDARQWFSDTTMHRIVYALRFIPVVPDEGIHASAAVCAAAGAPSWIVENMPTAGGMQ